MSNANSDDRVTNALRADPEASGGNTVPVPEMALLPCPFCGSEPSEGEYSGALHFQYFVSCDKCAVEPEVVEDSAEMARLWWNKRAAPSMELTAPIAGDASGSPQISEFERDESSSVRGETDGQVYCRHLQDERANEGRLGMPQGPCQCEICKRFRLTASTPAAPERNTGLGRMEVRLLAQTIQVAYQVIHHNFDEQEIPKLWKMLDEAAPVVLRILAPSDPEGAKSDSATSVSSPKSAVSAGQEEGEWTGEMLESLLQRGLTWPEVWQELKAAHNASLREKEEQKKKTLEEP